MRGDKFAAKRSRAYRVEKRSEHVVEGPNLEGCIRGFMDISGLPTYDDARAVLLIAGLGLALSGPDAFHRAVSAFNASHG